MLRTGGWLIAQLSDRQYRVRLIFQKTG